MDAKTEPSFRFTTIQCNRGFASKVHVDSNNVGESRIIALGPFTGGQLWLFDRVITKCTLAEAKGMIPLTIKDKIYGFPSLKPGDIALGSVVDIRNKPFAFNGKTTPHAVLPFMGERYSLVFFVHNCFHRATSAVIQELRQLGFNPPTSLTALNEVDDNPLNVTKELQKVGGRPVVLQACGISDLGENPTSDFPVQMTVDPLNICGPIDAQKVGGPFDSQKVGGHPVVNDWVYSSFAVRPKFRELWCKFFSSGYESDIWPRHWDDRRCQNASRYYKAMPELFYSGTGLGVVRPENVMAWVSVCKDVGVSPLLQECMSGSGKLSLFVVKQNCFMMFPVDFRYGWDLGTPAHVKLLAHARSLPRPVVNFFSPNCTPWSKANRGANREEQRRLERSTLQWVNSECLALKARGYGAVVETPDGSALFQESPLSSLIGHDDVLIDKVDQCQHGCKDSDNNSIRKRTLFARVNVGLSSKTVLLCGDKFRCQKHGELRGKQSGTSLPKTAFAAVYPGDLCFGLVQDFLSFSAGGSKISATQVVMHNDIEVYWRCRRCQHGRTMPDGSSSGEHTRVPGNCKAPSLLEEPKFDAAPKFLPPPEPLPDAAPLPRIRGAPLAVPASLHDDVPAQAKAVAEAAIAEDAAAVPVAEPEVGPVVVPRVALPDVDVVREQIAHIPDCIEPSFNSRHLKKKLENASCTEQEAEKLILGLHYKMWHLPLREMQRFLKRGW